VMVMTLLLVMLGVVVETEEAAEAPVFLTGSPLMYEGTGSGVYCAGGTKGNLRELSPDGFETMREDIV